MQNRQGHLETTVEFLPHPRQRGRSLDHSELARWLRPRPAKMAPFYAGVDNLSQSFEILRFHVMLAADPIQGKVTIEVDRPNLVGSVSFWNKGDVEAMAVDKIHKQEHSLDDRVLTADDDVSVLLRSYFERMQSFSTPD